VRRRGFAQGLREKKLAQENLDKVDKLKPIAEKLGVPLAQLALAWHAARPHSSALTARDLLAVSARPQCGDAEVWIEPGV